MIIKTPVLSYESTEMSIPPNAKEVVKMRKTEYTRELQKKMFEDIYDKHADEISTEQLFEVINLIRKKKYVSAYAYVSMIHIGKMGKDGRRISSGYVSNCCYASMKTDDSRCPECKEGCKAI